jgi:hypothetical protein
VDRVPWLRRDAAGRPALLGQLAIIGIFLGFYDAIRNLAPGRVGLAVTNARHLLHAERILGIDVEHPINHFVAAHHALGYVTGTLYDSLHYLITFPLLGLIYVRFPQHYRRQRDILMAVNALGLVVFWLVPLAPPRLTDTLRYADVVADTHALGGWGTTISSNADQYAAMPSLHVGWALWVTVAVFAITQDRRLRAVAAAYPVVTVVVIVATGNHWILDGLAGAVCLLVSVVAVDQVLARVRPRSRVATSEPHLSPVA